jgi:uncharacterized membrane protein YraQ (UPF0718 family)
MQRWCVPHSMMWSLLVLEFVGLVVLIGLVIALVVGVLLRKLRHGLDYLTKKSGISSIDS